MKIHKNLRASSHTGYFKKVIVFSVFPGRTAKARNENQKKKLNFSWQSGFCLHYFDEICNFVFQNMTDTIFYSFFPSHVLKTFNVLTNRLFYRSISLQCLHRGSSSTIVFKMKQFYHKINKILKKPMLIAGKLLSSFSHVLQHNYNIWYIDLRPSKSWTKCYRRLSKVKGRVWHTHCEETFHARFVAIFHA